MLFSIFIIIIDEILSPGIHSSAISFFLIVEKRSPEISRAVASETRRIPPPQSSDFNIAYIVVLIIAVVIGSGISFGYKYFSQQDGTLITSTKNWKEIVTKLHPHLIEKGNKFPSQHEDVWYKILAGLKGLIGDPQKPAVYLLTYDDGSVQPTSCVAEIITTAANK